MKLSEIKRNLKHCLKEKIKINQKTIITFLMMGFISFSNGKLHIGSSLTDTSTAIGRGSISTGKNTQALGTNSFASGNNMSREQYEELLRANNEKLREIESKTNLLNDDLEVLENLKNENRDLNTKLEFMRNVENRINAVETERNSRSPELIREIEEKKGFEISYKREIDDLENRINIINNMNLDNLNINDNNSLRDYAIELKRQMEDGKTFINEYGENGIDLEEYIQFFRKIPAKYKDSNPTKDKFTSINDENEFLFMAGDNNDYTYNKSNKPYDDYKKWIEKKDNGDIILKTTFDDKKLFRHINDVFNTSLNDKTNIGLEKPEFRYGSFGNLYEGDFDKLNKQSIDDYLYGRSDTYEIKFRPITGLKKETVNRGYNNYVYYYYTQDENYETPEEFYTNSGISKEMIDNLNILNKEKYDIRYKHLNIDKITKHRELLNEFITLKREFDVINKKEDKNDNDYLRMDIINNKIINFLNKDVEEEFEHLDEIHNYTRSVNDIMRSLLNINSFNANTFEYSENWNSSINLKTSNIENSYYDKLGKVVFIFENDLYKIKANEYYKDLLNYFEGKINEHNYSEFENKIRELDEIKDLKNTNSTLIEKFRKEIDRLKALERTVSDEIIVKERELNGFEIELTNLRNSLERVNPESVEELRNNIEEKERIVNEKRAEIETLKNSLVELSDGENAIATGNETVSTGKNATGIGTHNLVFAENGTALGNNITLIGENLVAIGEGHSIVGRGSGTLGDPNVIYGNNNYVIGNNNKVGRENAPKNNVFILGSNIDATNVEDSITLGNNSKAISGAVSVGSENATRKIHYVKEAEISATSKEAVNGSQLFALADGSSGDINVNNWKNKLGITDDGNVIANTLSVDYTDDSKTEINLGKDGNLTTIHNVNLPKDDFDAANKIYVDMKTSEALNGVKSYVNNASAMANIPQVSGDKLFSFGAGAAYNGGKVGSFALGISGQDKKKKFIYKASAGLSTDLKWQVALGFSYSLGNTDTDTNGNINFDKLMAENEKLKGNLNNLSTENNKLKDDLNDLKDEIKNLKDLINNNKEKVEVVGVSERRFVINNFNFNKFGLKEEHIKLLDEILNSITSENSIEIIGYTDMKGKDKYNLNLGLNRAKAVMDYLLDKNNDLNIRISSQGFNKILNKDDSKLRRVEIIIK